MQTHLQLLTDRCVVCAVQYVYIDSLSCVCCFLLPRPLLAPAEQLVLTAIRQEASEQQDPGQSASAMRACLTDRFDKSEFTQIRLDDAPFVSGVKKVHVPYSGAGSR